MKSLTALTVAALGLSAYAAASFGGAIVADRSAGDDGAVACGDHDEKPASPAPAPSPASARERARETEPAPKPAT